MLSAATFDMTKITESILSLCPIYVSGLTEAKVDLVNVTNTEIRNVDVTSQTISATL